MEVEDVGRYIRETFDGVEVSEYRGDSFYIYDPAGDLPAARQMPFATIVVGDHYERVSRLDEAGAYRLNVGLTKGGYRALFGAVPTRQDENGVLETGFDYAVRDRVMPHPVYAAQHWVCVVNPSAATFETVRPMLDEAYEFAVRKHANWQARAGTGSR